MDGHQFHQYQQNEQSPLILTELVHKKIWLVTLVIQVLAWDRHNNVVGLIQVNVIYQIHVVSITGDHVCCL